MKDLAKLLAGTALAFLFAACTPPADDAASEAGPAAPAETADEFVARINAEYRDWWREINAADWLRATYINDDSAIVSAKANERFTAWHAAAVDEARRCDGQDLSPETRRAHPPTRQVAKQPVAHAQGTGVARHRRIQVANQQVDVMDTLEHGRYQRAAGSCLALSMPRSDS